MKRTAIYARISDDAEGKALGVTRQIKECQDLVQRLGWLLGADPYVDNDISASTGKPRPAYQHMLADIEAGKVDAVVVWALDRLHRRPIELEHFIALVERKGVALANVSGDVDISTDDGQLHARIMGAVAANEARKIGRRIKSKQAQLREAGMPFGGGIRCFGWGVDRLTPVETEQAEIAKMVAWVLAGRSVHSLVQDLQDREVPTVSAWMQANPSKRRPPDKKPVQGRPWSQTSVKTLLTKPRLAGLLTYQGEIVGTGAWEPVIDRETFDRLQVALKHRSPATRKAHRGRRYLLSGIAVCGTCGTGLQVGSSPDGKAEHRRYRCPTVAAGTTRGSGVLHGGRNMRHLDGHVVDALLVALDVMRLAPDEGEPLPDPGPQIDALRERLNAAADLFADGQISAEQFTRVSSRLRPQIDALDVTRPDAGAETLLDWYVGTRDPDDARDAYLALPLEQQRRVLVTTLGPRGSIVVDPAAVLNHGFDASTVQVTWQLGTPADPETRADAYQRLRATDAVHDGPAQTLAEPVPA